MQILKRIYDLERRVVDLYHRIKKITDGGSGGSQNLDQTLLNGNTSEQDIVITGNDTSSIMTGVSFISVLNDQSSNTVIRPGTVQIGKTDPNDFGISNSHYITLLDNSIPTVLVGYTHKLQDADGTIAHSENITLQTALTNNGIAGLSNGDDTFSIYLQNYVDATNSFTSMNSRGGTNGGTLYSSNGIVHMQQKAGDGTLLSDLSFETPIASAVSGGAKFLIPAKPDRALPYMLALLDDVTLQGILDTGTEATFGNSSISILSDLGDGREFIVSTVKESDNTIMASIASTPIEILIQQRSGSINSSLDIQNGILNITQRNTSGVNSTNLTFETPVSASIIKIPAKSVGTYTLATTVDAVKGSLIASLTSSGNADQALTTTAAILAFDTNDNVPYGTISRTANTFTISAGGNGLYIFNVQPQVTENSVMNVTTIWCQKNGVNVANSGIVNSSTGIGDTRVIPLVITLDLVAGDQITFLGVTSIVNGATLDFTTAVGPKPSVPSVIIDIKGWKK